MLLSLCQSFTCEYKISFYMVVLNRPNVNVSSAMLSIIDILRVPREVVAITLIVNVPCRTVFLFQQNGKRTPHKRTRENNSLEAPKVT